LLLYKKQGKSAEGAVTMSKLDVSLDDRYHFDGRPFYLNGTQSLVRLTMLELRRRRAAGFRTAVYATGYRGSPLGGFDQSMQGAAKYLGKDIVFRPAVNEDLAATAVWGTQQLGTFGHHGRYDGVSALWYGKGPGVDRSGDAFKHGNLAGSASGGGVLVVAGDDHTCKSSTTAHQSEFALVAAMIPVLAPSSIAEQMEYGLIGWQLSRATGLWAGLKVVTEIMDSSESLLGDPVVALVTHQPLALPTKGLSLRWPDSPLAQEERLHRYKLPAAIEFARANRLDRVIFGKSGARLGVITVGKTYADTRQAMSDLDLDERRAEALGIRLYKVAMPWPLERTGIREFANGLEEILVIEEKRGLVEDQVRQHLYGMQNSPRILGKYDEHGEWLFPSNGDLGAGVIARGLGSRIVRVTPDSTVSAALTRLNAVAAVTGAVEPLATRPPHFCPGCPHSTSTKVPEGSKAFAGIGCHYLVLPMERDTEGFTQMGGEGANWVGLAPFSATEHMFQNIGDGTYFHSGSLAIRAAVAANVNLTYKILYNHAVAMTGGQPIDGELTLPQLCRQVAAEGVKRIVVVSDDPSRYPRDSFPDSVQVRHRDDLDAVQRSLRDTQGVTVIIYDQTCATELRRLRKRGRLADPKLAIVINDLVCEGCGDCSRTSNCLAVVPIETEFGRKRAIDQSTCNKDQSCLKGFCPSFVTVEGGTLRKPELVESDGTGLPEPIIRAPAGPCSVIVTGIGGTGVVTIGALIGMAAHIDGKAVRVMDMTGLAQKGGAVVSHIKIAASSDAIHAAKISAGTADLMIACDLVVAAASDNLSRLSRSGHVIANDHETATGAFTRDPNAAVPVASLRGALLKAVRPGFADFCDATELAGKLVGDAVGANLFLVGLAWQRGLLPLSLQALEQAIALNGVAVSLNKAAFTWGRRAALDLPFVKQAAGGGELDQQRLSTSLDESIARRVVFLTDYQHAAYAERYLSMVTHVAAVETYCVPGRSELTYAVARSLFQLMAYKDEYEVARLHTDTGFVKRIKERFDGPYKLNFHLAPPLFAKRDAVTGVQKKMRFGSWMYLAFRLLARARRLRGTTFDIFGHTAERRQERRLIVDFESLINDQVLPTLTPHNHAEAVELAELPQSIKGYGHIKERNLRLAKTRETELLERYRSGVRPAAVPLVGNQPLHLTADIRGG
jgi:indolepyruvate ferredoxin oxidoreductase